MKSMLRVEFVVFFAALAMTHCTDDTSGSVAGTGGTMTGGTGGVAGTTTGGTGGAVAGTGGISEGGTGGIPPSGGHGGGGAMDHGGGAGGVGATDGGAGDAEVTPMNLAPSTRNPKYKSLTPTMGAPLDKTVTPGTWKWAQIDGAVNRDGTASAGFYYKISKTGNKNLMVYLVGGGACQDTFFCNNNPANKNTSLTADRALAGVQNIFGPDGEAQDPTLAKWQSGIFKDDPTNPVKDWNMVYIPYVTGDVYAGNKPNGTVTDYDGKTAVSGTFQFVGRSNMLKFVARIVPTFSDAQVVLLTGSSAGGIGALMSCPIFVDGFIDQAKGARVLVVDDAGPVFTDKYLPACLQTKWRQIWNLNDSFPEDCSGCRGNAGDIVGPYLAYLVDKYPDNLLGGLIDSDDDEIMEMFFADGNTNCQPGTAAPWSLWGYTQANYSAGLKDLINNNMKRMSSYIWAGREHQNLFQTASGDRFYKDNGLGKTVAAWLTTMLTGKEEHLGLK